MTAPSQTIPLDEHTMLQLDPDQYDENRINIYFEYNRPMVGLLVETGYIPADTLDKSITACETILKEETTYQRLPNAGGWMVTLLASRGSKRLQVESGLGDAVIRVELSTTTLARIIDALRAIEKQLGE
ncbi:hypothetical protein I6I10_06855 [Corynebacterium glucuronolyticum]|uniref:Uncharacterized protein n=1 Tax=Corynebacterium glucuronolyticum TaxID=39791 RepID=A0A7T4JW57_9CORY|nr:hypothetical protein [Corynebacterium glucuronolyticum]QQB47581.1 hypothetical protein I6I10_06855 [Corynebacterium glucuronolyticum]WKD64058.1 hypothetical protein CGLUCO_09065 [Corynebacterium glucuronolyticum DSM 44120]SMB82280.1 hypothetical protein SAMN05660745_02605 [Corynebacterium glucuronolyticum]